MTSTSHIMGYNSPIHQFAGWAFGLLVVAIGVANLVLIHPVPGVAYLLLSLVYLPPANNLFRKKAGFSVPLPVKVSLAIVIIMFTLGVSDLGDMIDGLSGAPQQVDSTLLSSGRTAG